MSRRRSSNALPSGLNFDYILLMTIIGISVLGIVTIYSVNYDPENPISQQVFSFRQHGRQAMWLVLSLIAGVIIMIIDGRFFKTIAIPAYIISIILLIAVQFVGIEVNGARSWFSFGPIRFQPSELAKLTTCLAVAAYLSEYKRRLDRDIISQIAALGIIALPMVLILVQGDAGSALIFSAITLALYREGMPLPWYLIPIACIATFILTIIFGWQITLVLTSALALVGGAALIYDRSFTFSILMGIGGVILFLAACLTYYLSIELILGLTAIALISSCIIFALIKMYQGLFLITFSLLLLTGLSFTTDLVFNQVLQKHQQDRINVWLRPHLANPQGALYNLTQSKIAIGSGSVSGKGFLKGERTQLDYVPEQSTDFIFSVHGEEQGFVGTLSMIIGYLIVLMRLLFLGDRQRSAFSRVYIVAVMGILLFHVLINIGMTVGLMPVIGIPLPFMSYGGSSLLVFMTMIFIALRLDQLRKVEFT